MTKKKINLTPLFAPADSGVKFFQPPNFQRPGVQVSEIANFKA